MIQFIKEAFNEREDDVFIKSGIPRTDFFFNDIERARIKKQLEKEFPLIKEKNVILYAPTYREYELDQFKFERSEEHTSELQSRGHLVCRLLLEKKTQKASAHDQALRSASGKHATAVGD